MRLFVASRITIYSEETEYHVLGEAEINHIAATVTNNTLQIVKIAANGQGIPVYVEDDIVLSLISSFAEFMNNI